MRQTIYITYKNKKCPVIISDEWEGKDEIDKEYNTILLECKEWNFRQAIPVEDLPWFLEDMGNIIDIKKEIDEELKADKTQVFQMRLSNSDKLTIEEKAKQNWYKNISAYIRDRALQS